MSLHQFTIRAYDKQAKEFRDVVVTLDIDLCDVANQLGRKAYQNKTSKATALAGAIKVLVN